MSSNLTASARSPMNTGLLARFLFPLSESLRIAPPRPVSLRVRYARENSRLP